MDKIQAFLAERAAELQSVRLAVLNGLNSGFGHGAYAPPTPNAISTALTCIVLANIFAVCTTRAGRSVVFKTIDTAIAVFLLAVILVIVLGLPIAVAYLSWKALLFIGASALRSPALGTLKSVVAARLPTWTE